MEYAQIDTKITRLPVSVLIITRNEERAIARCLASVSWADEILVIDSESTDQTPVICQAAGKPWSGKMRFFSRAWTGFKDQRNFALQKASHDWVLVIDADEACSPELATRILGLLSETAGPKFAAYKIRRVEYFLDRPIGYGIWNPSYQDRFFHRQGVQYINNVHEYPVFKDPPQRIHEPIFHAPDFNIERFLDKMNRYTTIEAQSRILHQQKTNWFRIFFAFPAMFFKNYFYYKAYRDGFSGFVISILEGISRAVRHVKMWQYQKNAELRK